VGGWLGG